jgi:hypothetical protein
LAVAPEEAHHPFGLLKGLDGSVEQKAVEAAIVKSNVMLRVLEKAFMVSSKVGYFEGYTVAAFTDITRTSRSGPLTADCLLTLTPGP